MRDLAVEIRKARHPRRRPAPTCRRLHRHRPRRRARARDRAPPRRSRAARRERRRRPPTRRRAVRVCGTTRASSRTKSSRSIAGSCCPTPARSNSPAPRASTRTPKTRSSTPSWVRPPPARCTRRPITCTATWTPAPRARSTAIRTPRGCRASGPNAGIPRGVAPWPAHRGPRRSRARRRRPVTRCRRSSRCEADGVPVRSFTVPAVVDGTRPGHHAPGHDPVRPGHRAALPPRRRRGAPEAHDRWCATARSSRRRWRSPKRDSPACRRPRRRGRCRRRAAATCCRRTARPVPVRIVGTVAQARSGLAIEPCTDSVDLDRGSNTVQLHARARHRRRHRPRRPLVGQRGPGHAAHRRSVRRSTSRARPFGSSTRVPTPTT